MATEWFRRSPSCGEKWIVQNSFQVRITRGGGVERERRMSKVWHESDRWIFSGRLRGSIGLVDLLGSVLGSVEGRNPVRTKCCESQASVNLKQGRLGCLDGYSETFWGSVRFFGERQQSDDAVESARKRREARPRRQTTTNERTRHERPKGVLQGRVVAQELHDQRVVLGEVFLRFLPSPSSCCTTGVAS